MGLFGHGGHLSKAAHAIGHTLDHYDEVLRSHGSNDIYIGASYGANGLTPSFTSVNGEVSMGGSYSGMPNSKPTGYTANAAATANSIAQGGMTKQQVQDYNIKHPNETAWRNE